MPLYEFRCGQCHGGFDKLIRTMAGAALEVTHACPHCGSVETRRLVSSISLLKGAGPGVGRAAYPTSWSQANAGDPETVKYWKRRVEREMHQESVDPGLKVERDATANRRWNDYLTRGLSGREMGQASETLQAAANVVDHDHDHGHGHDHAHPHPHPRAGAADATNVAGGAPPALPTSPGTPSTSATNE